MRKPRLIALLLFALALPLAAQERKASGAGEYHISGVLLNATNSLPLARAYVTITLSGAGASFTRTVVTGTDGRFLFDRLRAGKYSLTAERRGFAPQGYEEHEGRFSTGIVTGAGLNSSDLVFRVSPDASLSGRITDDRNEPVRNARVMLIHELMVEGQMGKRIVANTSTDDRGYYHFAHLRPGAYYIAVSARPWYAQPNFVAGTSVIFDRPGGIRGAIGDNTQQGNPALDMAYALTFYPGATEWTAASAITLQTGDRASTEITLRAVPALHVRINTPLAREQAANQRRFVRATLVQTMFDGIEVPIPAGMREIGGSVVMAGVPPGHYLLRFNPNAGRRMQEDADDEQDADQPARVREIDLFSDTDLDAAELPPAAMVSGTVKVANGLLPAKTPTIELRRGALRRIFPARTNDKGEFSFPEGFAAGSYEVLMSSGEDLYIQSVTASGARVAGRLLQISGSDPVKLTIVAVGGAGKIEGVALRDGEPRSGAMIVLVPDDPANNLPLFRRDQSDSDGSFTLAPVLPGRYTLLALEKGWDLPWGDFAALKPFLAEGERIAVEPKGSYKLQVNVQ